jgi:hypothetical protein
MSLSSYPLVLALTHTCSVRSPLARPPILLQNRSFATTQPLARPMKRRIKNPRITPTSNLSTKPGSSDSDSSLSLPESSPTIDSKTNPYADLLEKEVKLVGNGFRRRGEEEKPLENRERKGSGGQNRGKNRTEKKATRVRADEARSKAKAGKVAKKKRQPAEERKAFLKEWEEAARVKEEGGWKGAEAPVASGPLEEGPRPTPVSFNEIQAEVLRQLGRGCVFISPFGRRSSIPS